MKKPKITPGKWEPHVITGIYAGVGVKTKVDGGIMTEVIFDTILPDTDDEYDHQKEKIESEVHLACKAGNITNAGYNIEAIEDLVLFVQRFLGDSFGYPNKKLDECTDLKEMARKALKKAKFESLTK